MDSCIFVGNDGHSRAGYRCLCDCGQEITRAAKDIVNGYVSSCGCNYKGVGHQDRVIDVMTNSRLRSKPEGRKWHKEVMIRDHYICRRCKRGGSDRVQLHAHHILNFSSNIEQRYDVSNGICLCEKCHSEFHVRNGSRNNNLAQLELFMSDHWLISINSASNINIE